MTGRRGPLHAVAARRLRALAAGIVGQGRRVASPYPLELGDPRDDLDLAGYGIVNVFDDRLGDTYPDMPWEPKAAFTALAANYESH